MKLFNNVLVYRIREPGVLPEELNQVLCQLDSQEPGPLQPRRLGFVPPLGGGDMFVVPLPVGEQSVTLLPRALLVTMREVKRDLSGRAVRRYVNKRVREIEQAEDRRVGGREKARIKQEITEHMLPRAPLVDNDVSAIIHGDLIYIGTASVSRAEDLLGLLRAALERFPAAPLHTNVPAGRAMSTWLQFRETGDESILIGNSFKAEDVFEKGSKLSGSHISLSDDALAELVDGMGSSQSVTELGLVYSDGEVEIPFTLTADMQLKGIEWPEDYGPLVHDTVGEDYSEEAAGIARHTIVFGGLRPLVNALIRSLRGLATSGSDDEEDSNEDLL